QARSRVLSAPPKAVRQQPRARDLMAQPARSVPPDETVAAAMIACQRHGQSGILVVEGERLVGAVGREDLDKAIGHGLSHAPVKGIMSRRVPTVSEDVPLAELQSLLGGTSEGRVAVLAGERGGGGGTRAVL